MLDARVESFLAVWKNNSYTKVGSIKDEAHYLCILLFFVFL